MWKRRQAQPFANLRCVTPGAGLGRAGRLAAHHDRQHKRLLPVSQVRRHLEEFGTHSPPKIPPDGCAHKPNDALYALPFDKLLELIHFPTSVSESWKSGLLGFQLLGGYGEPGFHGFTRAFVPRSTSSWKTYL